MKGKWMAFEHCEKWDRQTQDVAQLKKNSSDFTEYFHLFYFDG